MHLIKIGERSNIKRLFDLDAKLKKIALIRNEKRDIYPINLESEKTKFIEAFKKGVVYNPQFRYDSVDYTKTDIQRQIDLLREEFVLFNHELSAFYIGILDYFDEWVTVFSSDSERSSNRFADGLFQLYGKVDFRGITLAKEVLKTHKRIIIPDSEKIYDAQQLSDIFDQKMISELKIDPWKTVIKDIPGRVGLSGGERKIYINKNARFSESDINSLLMHEIGVHVYRTQTGYDLGLFGFTIGSVNNETTEEGIAIRKSLSVNNTKPNILFEASVNCMIASLVDTMDFHDLFVFLREKYSDDLDWCFGKACRVKRSLEDTSIFGGFTKDQVYMKGYAIVKDLDEKTYKEDLFKYRLAASELNYISTLDLIKRNKHLIIDL